MIAGLLKNLSLAIVLGAALAGCGGGGGGDDGASSSGGSAIASIGAAGGTVVGPAGAQVVIPAGALATTTTIGVAQSSVGAPALPAAVTAFGPMFAFTPHGTSFATAVTITVSFDPALVPAGTTPVLYKTNAAMTGWAEVVGATVSGNSMSGTVTGFSLSFVGPKPPPLVSFPELTERKWELVAADRASDPLNTPPLSADTQVGGELALGVAIGRDLIIAPPRIGGPRASVDVHSNGAGTTYWTLAEAPHSFDTDVPHLDESSSELTQTYTFKKQTNAAKLHFVVSRAQIEAVNQGGRQPGLGACPWLPSGASPSQIDGECTVFMTLASNHFTLEARRLFQADAFFSIGGEMEHDGMSPNWDQFVQWPGESDVRLWTEVDFQKEKDLDGDGAGRHALFRLTHPITIDVPLTGVTAGETFNVVVNLNSAASNLIQGESYVGAFLRDPLDTNAGVEVSFTGLEQLPVVHDERPPQTPVACGGTPVPSAGTIRFTASDFRAPERTRRAGIGIERVGGTQGDVAVLFETADGTAVAGRDYKSVKMVVRFPDGQGGQKVVRVPLISNATAEPDETVHLKITPFRGCVALDRSTATLTILDDDRPPLPAPSSGLDPTFGSAGTVTTKFGGKNTAMALQADGKIVMAGGSITDFLLARYNADGSLDAGFGVGGLVTTDIGNFAQEEARAVAVQPDGKIVVVGNVRFTQGAVDTFFFTLVRYNTDGSLDASFGQGGKVTSAVIGRAFAVALQSGGKIVVAGDDTLTPTLDNVELARFNADGSLDTGFGNLGSVTTDVTSGDVDGARNIVMQPDGAIVISGSFSKSSATGVARYNADGNPDGTFGAFGRVEISGALVGEGLALQSDGKLVLVGSKQVGVGTANVTQFELRRLSADGSVDVAFGSGGTVDTAFSTSQDSAQSVTLQADGKILVSGTADGFQFGLARYNADGTLDAGFAASGKLKIAFFGLGASAENVVVLPDGKILLGGFASDGGRPGYALARVNP